MSRETGEATPGGPPGRRIPRASSLPVRVLAVLSATLGWCAPLSAQLAVRVTAGATASTPLVRDSIVQPLTVGPKVAPSLAVGADAPLSDWYRLGIELRHVRSDLIRREGGVNTTLLPLTIWSASLTLRRRVTPWAGVTGRVGAARYVPAAGGREATFFRTERPLLPAVGASVTAAVPLWRSLTAGIEIGYDLHRFATLGLRDQGIAGNRTVHRVTMGVTLGTGR